MSATTGLIWENVLTVGTLVRAAARGEYGQTLAEYGLLLTLVAVGVVVPTLILMRTALAGAFTDVGNCLLGTGC